jgi:hypothetical protein
VTAALALHPALAAGRYTAGPVRIGRRQVVDVRAQLDAALATTARRAMLRLPVVPSKGA